MNIRLQIYRLKKRISHSKGGVIKISIALFIFLALMYFLRSQPVQQNTHKIITAKNNYRLQQKPYLDGKANATFVILVRNADLNELKKTIKNLERVFNKRYNYPYVFLNDVPFTEEFKRHVRDVTDAKIEFGVIPSQHWGLPNWIEKEKFKKDIAKMEADKVIYGGSVSYRHMCRYESGFFFRHNLTLKYNYYWRVEPGVSFDCIIDFDPFRELIDKKKKYGFVISLYEFEATIMTLWRTINKYLTEKNLWNKLPMDNAMEFISNDRGKTYNLCHFWSNFEIADFGLWRSQSYLDFFDYLDKAGGFFYERWGDAPVHSIYASLFLKREEIHFFNKIGYTHPPYSHCPIEPELNKGCFCDPKNNFDNDGYSCTKRWFDFVGHK